MKPPAKPLTDEQLKSVVGGSYVIVAPQALPAAAHELREIAAALSAQIEAVDGSALAADATDGITAASPANLAGVGGGGSVVVKAPEAVTSAAAGLQELGGALSAQAAAVPKTDK